MRGGECVVMSECVVMGECAVMSGGWVEGVSEKGGVHWSLIEVCFIGEGVDDLSVVVCVEYDL